MSPRGSSIIAIVFDFDETLTGDSTTRLLAAHGIDTDLLWNTEVPKLVEEGYDPTLAWLNLFLDKVGEGKPLGPLSNKDLREFGAGLDTEFSPGIPQLFDDLRRIVAEYRDIQIEFYVVSGGLEEVIRGSKVVDDNMTDVWGCVLADDEESGVLSKIKRCVTFTEKTRYLFEINKGLFSKDTRRKPYLVNKFVAAEDRRVPFSNMIYVGDGLTDIPCFSLLRTTGGLAFGVFDPTESRSARRAFLEFLEPGRVTSMHAPRYGEHDDLGALLRTAVGQRCARIALERERA
jgi:hypothetical protein